MIPSYQNQPAVPGMYSTNNPNYNNWINPQPSTPQPQQVANEQKGITAVYMANSKNDYGTLIPPAGQTIAIFNFNDGELVFKTRDIWGIDVNMRTFEIKEKTQNATPVPTTPAPVPIVSPPTTPPAGFVSQEKFDELSAKFNELYNELKG